MKALSPRAAARMYSISDRTFRRFIAEGLIPVFACGRKSVCLLTDVEAAIRSQRPPKSSRARYNTEQVHA